MATLTTNKNLLQTTGFKILINRQNYPNLEFFAQSVIHPGVQIPPVELPAFSIRSIPLAGDKLNYDELTVDILLDENIESYKEMYSWLLRMSQDGQVNATEVAPEDRIPTYADITVSLLTSNNNENVKFKYKDCLPTSVGQISLSSSTGDVGYLVFTASFRFTSFDIL